MKSGDCNSVCVSARSSFARLSSEIGEAINPVSL
jgi:hypothetical protein